jgi:hypothetical protein
MRAPVSRRAALSGALVTVPGLAAVAALSGPSTAFAANPDPIFAAIERHKKAWRTFSATCDLTDNVLAEKEGRIVTEADEAIYEAASDAEHEARAALFNTPAQTAAGMRAFIEHHIEYDAGLMDEVVAAFLASLLQSPVLGEVANV